MPATLLSVIQSHCKRHALSVPTSVTGSTDTQIIQLWEILNDILAEMVRESDFNVSIRATTHVLIASQDQGAISTIAPGFQFALLETFFDRTLKRPLYGPVSETEWEELQALPTAGTWYKYRLWQDHLWIDPVPAAPFSTIAFEYMTSYSVVNGVTAKEATTDDADQFLFPDPIIKRGLAFYWKQIKGLPYQADEKKYYDMLTNYIARDKVKRRINVAEPVPIDLRPGIFVPSNTWPV